MPVGVAQDRIATRSKPEAMETSAGSPPTVTPRKGTSDEYSVTRVLAASPDRTLLLGRAGHGGQVILYELVGKVDAEPATQLDGSLSLQLLDQGSHDAQSFFVYKIEDYTPLCSCPPFRWDLGRLELLGNLVTSLRRARDLGIFLPDCEWLTACVGTRRQIRWLSPQLRGSGRPRKAPADAAAADQPGGTDPRGADAGNQELTPPMAPSWGQRILSSLSRRERSSEKPPPVSSLEKYYFDRLQEMVGDLVKYSFSEPVAVTPVDERADDEQASPVTFEEDEVDDEDAAAWPEFAASVEMKELLSGIIEGRIGTLDDAWKAIDAFGSGRIVRLRSGWSSHRGLVREINEDALLVLEQSSVICARPLRTVLYAVADGMGGHEAGEIASEITLKALAIQMVGGLNLTSALEHGRDIFDHGFLMQTASLAIEETNRTVRRYSDDAHKHSDRRPGSTLVFALACGPVLTVGHVGDSRAYKITAAGNLERITKDHSPVQRLVDRRQITPDEAFVHPYRHQIFSSIGVAPDVLEKAVQVRYLKENEGLLLCSDGLSDMLKDRDIEAVCRAHLTDSRRLARALVDAACDKGGNDNVTVVVVFRPAVPFQEQRENSPNTGAKPPGLETGRRGS
jgi:protein phosphatase